MKKDADFCISVLSVFQLCFRMGEATLRFSGVRFAAGESFASRSRRESPARAPRRSDPFLQHHRKDIAAVFAFRPDAAAVLVHDALRD